MMEKTNVAPKSWFVSGSMGHTEPGTYGSLNRPPEFYRPATRPRAGKGTFVVGVCGAARSGKNTVAEHIVATYGQIHAQQQGGCPGDGTVDVRQYALADSLKIECYEWLKIFRYVCFKYGTGWDTNFGRLVTPADAHPQTDERKIAWVNDFKKELRQFLQWFGTEYRRAQDADYWIDRLLERIAEDSPQVALVTDVRFANEIAICHVAMKVEKIGQVEDPTVASHVSEREWREHDFGPYVVRAAEGDLDALRSGAENVFERIVREFRVQ